MENTSKKLTVASCWPEALLEELMNTKATKKLQSFLKREREDGIVYPDSIDVFRIYKELQPPDVRVVILGIDPYLTPGVADGFAYSSKKFDHIPSMLNTIMREAYRQHDQLYRSAAFKDGRLDGWVSQGVFLLNKLLTSAPPRIGSHKNRGWEKITIETIKYLGSPERMPTVFLLWGSELAQMEEYIDREVHLVIKNVHPNAEKYSKKSKSFSEKNNCFKDANNFLRERGRGEIDWLASSLNN